MKWIALIIVLNALSVQAQVVFDPAQLQSISTTGQSVRKRLEPAKADPKAFDALVRRLIRDGVEAGTDEDPALGFEGRSPGPKAEGERLRVLLHGGLLEQREIGEPGSNFSDLALRYSYSHLEAVSSIEKKLKDGAVQVDSWIFMLGMDGAIASAARASMVVAPTQDGGAAIDEKRSKVAKLDPRDPSVLKRWKELEQKLRFLGPQTAI